jgi:DNA gyrase subunit A
VVVEVKRDAIPYIVLNQLYKHTQMQSTFGVIMLALVNGAPRVLTLREMLHYFIVHRHEVVVRRTQFELGKAQEREHILEGLKIAVDNIDEVIVIIRGSDTSDEAGERLRERFSLSERQSDAILNMRLAKLTGLEIEQLEAELGEVRAVISELQGILASSELRYQIIKDEMMEVADKYGDERRTEILGESGDFSIEDLIADEEMVITVSHAGYIKRMPVDTYRMQGRGGRGITGMDTKEEDWVEHLFIASTHDYLMIFTRDGQCYWLKVHQIPASGRNSRGKPIVNLINLDAKERLASVVPVRQFSSDRYLMFVTRRGTVKKTVLSAFGNPRVVGINAMNVLEGDELIDVQLTDGKSDVVLATHLGIAIRFHETDVREMGRATTGVRGITLGDDDVVIGMVVVARVGGAETEPLDEAEQPEGDEAAEPVDATEAEPGAEPATPSGPTLLVVTEKGMGKRTEIGAYRLQRRAGKGVINVRTTDKTGKVVAIKPVVPGDELMVITRNGIVNRQSVDGIRVIGRNTQGVRLVNLDSGDMVMDVACLLDDEDVEKAVEEAANAEPGVVAEAGEVAPEEEGTVGEEEVQGA